MHGSKWQAQAPRRHVAVAVFLAALFAACAPMQMPTPVPSPDAALQPEETATSEPEASPTPIAETPTETPVPEPPAEAEADQPTPTPVAETPTETPVPEAETPTETPVPEAEEGQPAPVAEVDVAGPSLITHPVRRREQCLDCHAVETGRVPAPSDHQGWTDDICLFCHLPAEEEEVDLPPLPEVASTEFCLACHGPYEELTTRTADSITDKEGVAGNPHMYVPHESTNIFSCNACHNVHSLPLTSLDEIPQADAQYCFLACHHEETFEPCAACH